MIFFDKLQRKKGIFSGLKVRHSEFERPWGGGELLRYDSVI